MLCIVLGILAFCRKTVGYFTLEYVAAFVQKVVYGNLYTPPPHTSSLELTAPRHSCLSFLNQPFILRTLPSAPSHPGGEASLNLRLAIVVTSMYLGGGLLWAQIAALLLPRCVLYTWDSSVHRQGGCVHQMSQGMALRPHSAALFPLSFLYFFSLVIVTCILPTWYWPPLCLLPVSISACSAVRALKCLLPVVGHAGGSRAVCSGSCRVSSTRKGPCIIHPQCNLSAWNIAGTE